jgi:uncharacterized membrane protein
VVKFWNLVTISEILPGGDTLGHFVVLKDVVANITSGRWFAPSYNIQWFGGEPLLQFYAPLGFMIMGIVAFLCKGAISLFLIYRWFIFFSFAIFPLAFYWFLREFLGKAAASYGLWFSLFWVFYPKAQSDLGIGASGAVALGLFSEALAVSIFLGYLALLKKLLSCSRFSPWIAVWGGLLLGLLILAHTLTFIGALIISGILIVFYLFNHHHRQALLLNLSLLFSLALLLSAFWFWPFIHNLSYTSAERINVSAFLESPLLPFLNFKFTDILSAGWYALPYAILIVFGFFIGGLARLIKEGKYELPVVFFVYFFIVGLDYVNSQIFITLTLHYYRLLALGFPMFLAIAAYGFYACWSEPKNNKWWNLAILGLTMIFLLHYLYFYQFGTTQQDNNITSLSVSKVIDATPYYFQLPQFKKFREANATVSALRGLQSTAAPVRVMPDLDPLSMYANLGSIHFFNTALPLANNQSVLFGLYAESSWQIPFIFPTSNALTGNSMLWGRVRDLAYNDYFNQQDAETMVKRLQLFGINYLITASNYFDNNVQKVKEAIPVNQVDIYKIYRLNGGKPMVYSADHQPGLYINGGGLDFRQFALGWYSIPELLDKPIAEWPNDIKDLNQNAVASFSFIVVALPTGGNDALIHKLVSFGKPLLILHSDSGISRMASSEQKIYEISNFRPVAGYYSSANFEQPKIDSLNSLRDFVVKFASPNSLASSTPVISSFTNNQVSFSGQGPVIINLGYFPYWRDVAGSAVFPVTPGQMLVFANGDTVLNYLPGSDAEIGKWISIISSLGVIIFLICFGKFKKKS